MKRIIPIIVLATLALASCTKKSLPVPTDFIVEGKFDYPPEDVTRIEATLPHGIILGLTPLV